MRLRSPAFENDGTIPRKHTCEGENVNPPLYISEIPENAKSLCIIMHDPDSPSGDFVHWIEYDIEPTELIDEGFRSGIQGINDFGRAGYGGPCPSKGMHHYQIDLFALDSKLQLPENSSRERVEGALKGHVLASAELNGYYKKGQ